MSSIDSVTIACPFDAHVHLRQPGELLELVVPQIAGGGIQSVYVMVSACSQEFFSDRKSPSAKHADD